MLVLYEIRLASLEHYAEALDLTAMAPSLPLKLSERARIVRCSAPLNLSPQRELSVLRAFVLGPLDALADLGYLALEGWDVVTSKLHVRQTTSSTGIPKRPDVSLA